MTRFPSHTPDSAPAAAKPMLAGSQKQFGFVPSPVAKVAASPVTLKHLLAGFAAFDHTSLSELEREVVAMTVAFEVGCTYCMALHSAQLARAEQPALLAALRTNAPLPDDRLEALRTFTRAIVHTHARPDDAAWRRFEAAGFTPAAALDVVLGVGVYITSTYLNILTAAELDPAFSPFAWTRPGATDASTPQHESR